MLNIEHHRLLVVHLVKMEKLTDTMVYLILGDNFLAKLCLLGETASVLLGSEDIAVLNSFKSEQQRE